MIFQLYRLHACYAVLVPQLPGRCHIQQGVYAYQLGGVCVSFRGCTTISSLTINVENGVLTALYISLGAKKRDLLSRDTSVTPYTRPPVSTDSATRDRPRDCRNLRQSTAICRSPPYSATFCRILPSSARTTTRSLFCPVHVLTKQPSQRYIPFSPCSLTFSPYATS